MRVLSCLVLIVLCSTGCYSPKNSRSYQPPEAIVVDREVEVSGDLDKTWKRLIANLADDFFVINNLDKDSGLINISFSAENPELYLTGGTTTRTFDGRTFVYDPVASSQFQRGRSWGFYNNLKAVDTIIRQTRMDGRANIIVSSSGEKVKVKVNCRYALQCTVSGGYKGYDASGGVVQSGIYPSNIVTVAIDSKSPTSKSYAEGKTNVTVTFQSKGVVEKRLLALARKE